MWPYIYGGLTFCNLGFAITNIIESCDSNAVAPIMILFNMTIAGIVGTAWIKSLVEGD